MNLAGMLTNYLISVGTRTPMLLLALVAIVIALARWRRHPGVSGLTAMAFLLYLFKSVTFAFLFQWLPRLRVSMNLSWERIEDRKSTRLNSSHVENSYAVFCLKKKKRK